MTDHEEGPMTDETTTDHATMTGDTTRVVFRDRSMRDLAPLGWRDDEHPAAGTPVGPAAGTLVSTDG